MTRLSAGLLGLLIAPMLLGASTKLTEAGVRALVQRQEFAWNHRDLEGYFATFSRDATFVDQARTPKGEVIRYGASNLAQAKTQSRRYLAKSKVVETGAVDAIVIASDGRTAQVFGHQVSRIEAGGRRQLRCAQTHQRVTLIGGRILSRGRTDTATRCRSPR